MTPNWTKMTWHEKYPTYVRHSMIGPQVQNSHPFRSTVSRFKNIALFYDFPFESMLKFQSATIF